MLTKLATQHNQQLATQSIADDRYEIRWEKIPSVPAGADTGEGSTWILFGDDPDAVRLWSTC